MYNVDLLKQKNMYKIDFNLKKNVLEKKIIIYFIDMMSTKTLHKWSIF